MRLTQPLRFIKRRQYENSYPHPIPFQELHPLQLIDRVEQQFKTDAARPCVPQLTLLLQCFKDSDFSQTRCSESIKNYYACIAEQTGKVSGNTKTRKLSDVKSIRDLNQLEATRLLKTKPLL